MKVLYTALAIACALPASALAAPKVAIDSALFVERIASSDSGRQVRSLEPADRLSRGDRVITIVDWRGTSPNSGFVVTNPLPRSLSYQKSSNGSEDVSVDGGRTFGRLETLVIKDGDRLRQASPEDVTHVRWRVPAQLAANGYGRITYSAIVR